MATTADWAAFCEAVKEYVKETGKNLEEFGGTFPFERRYFTGMLNGKGRVPTKNVKAIIKKLAELKGITSRSQARYLLRLANVADFPSGAWDIEPLKKLTNDDPSEIAKSEEQLVPAGEHREETAQAKASGNRKVLPLQEASVEGREAESLDGIKDDARDTTDKLQMLPSEHINERVSVGKSVNRKQLMQAVLLILAALALAAIIIVGIVILVRLWPTLMGAWVGSNLKEI